MAGKTVLITGANRGIGLSLARQLSQRGWIVLATARRTGDSDDGIAELRTVAHHVHTLDVTSEDSVHALGNALHDKAINMLINNSGVLFRESIDSFTTEQITRQFEVNALGPLRVTRALIPSLKLAHKTAGERAVVANITSRMGSIADNTSGGMYGYRASKAALNAFAKSLSIDLGDFAEVFLVHPGYIQTRMTGNTGDMSPDDAAQRIVENVLLKAGKRDGKFFHRDGPELPW